MITGGLGCNKNENDPCINCNSPNFIESIENGFFQVFFDSAFNKILVGQDSINNNQWVFYPCSEDELLNYELGKILKISGDIFENCESNQYDKFEISEITLAETCQESIPFLAGNFNLFRKWYFNSIETSDTTILVPCESRGAFIDFSFNDIHNMEAFTIPNSFNSEIWITDNTIETSDDFIGTLSVGTQSQMFFENLFLQVLGMESLAIFEINNNILTIQNPEKNIKITAYYTNDD